MPHFDEYGGDKWICQICCKIRNSRVESRWLPIPGKSFSGNVCPDCLSRMRQGEKSSQTYSQSEWNTIHGTQYEAEEAVQEVLNRLDYADNPAEYEVQKELRRTGIRNSIQPECCPECKSALQQYGGTVGETVLSCPHHGIVWEDAEDAIRRVL